MSLTRKILEAVTAAESSKGPRLSLELMCGSAEVGPEHPGHIRPGESVPDIHDRVETWANEAGIDVSIQPTVQDGVDYCDAYLYFTADRLGEVAEALRELDVEGDILDVPDGVDDETMAGIERVADENDWTVERE